jgi:hypothetical protein
MNTQLIEADAAFFRRQELRQMAEDDDQEITDRDFSDQYPGEPVRAIQAKSEETS